MKKIFLILIFFIPFLIIGQNENDSIVRPPIYKKPPTYKKRVLENVELDLLTSFYTQDGKNAAVTGGIGTEELTDTAGHINIAIPLNDDDIFSIDGTVSAYTSASSGNLNPFVISGSSSAVIQNVTGTPWAASSGASEYDVWASGVISYSHSSDSRNSVFSVNTSFAKEYDYISYGAGVGIVGLFGEKNTELGLSANVYLDQWKPEYATEIVTYDKVNGDLFQDFFDGVRILNDRGGSIDKGSSRAWKPSDRGLFSDTHRNTYSASISLSQILSKRLQFSLFSDVVLQEGLLSNPMQRVYFSDKKNFFIGDRADIPKYTSEENQGVFQLADDIERLPNNRLKIPIGLRLNYYVNESVALRTYYRYYFDDWGITSNTFNVELPIKLSRSFTIYPNYRYYTQTAANYFGAYEELLSTDTYYTSDYDLSKFNANQYGLGFKYTDVFTKAKFWKLGLKNVNLNINYYDRNTGLHATIVSFGTKLILE